MTTTISFVIPTFNAQKHLEDCLISIQKQDYPKDAVEVIIVDGGSSDQTIEIARVFNARVLSNPKKLAEYGVQIGVLNASGDFVVVFAADNELFGYDWIQRVVNIFANNKDVSAVWGRLVSGEDDTSLNKYFALIQSDPLNWFLNKNLSGYIKYAESICGERCYIFNVNPVKPLVWGANGLAYRMEKIKPIWAQEGYLGDNDAFQHMIEMGNNKVAYFNQPFVYHHHVAKITDCMAKWKRNFTQHLLDKANTRNMNWVFTRGVGLKLFFWALYSLFPLFSFTDSIRYMIKDRSIYWLYHSPVSFLQTVAYIKGTINTGKWKQVFSLIRINSRRAA